ncbi:MAG: GNAT family N-acetyltransferase [Chloroflexi bacterium]|nr:GNAT family N-acetyltransferase [Chloroflexota bacterium]
MHDFWTIRPMEAGEEEKVSALVRRVFDLFVAPEYEPEGIQSFYRYIEPQCLRERAAKDHDILLAFVDKTPVGVLELREGRHISLLFVDAMFQGRGIARALLEEAIALARQRDPQVAKITVNASPNSAFIYERLGFRATGPRQSRDGIIFIPMEKPLEPLAAQGNISSEDAP